MSALCSGFTLIEMLVVIAIIGIVAAMSVPALNNLRKADAVAAGTRQLLDDLSRARQLAISQRTTIYMVFVPRGFWNDPAYGLMSAAEKSSAATLLDKQLIGYNFISLRNVGDQPGQDHARYFEEWRPLPEGIFIPENFKFNGRTILTYIQDPTTNLPPHLIRGFEYTNNIPFPTADTAMPLGGYVWMPYIAFNHLGQLVSNFAEEVIPLARGTVAPALDSKKIPYQGYPTLEEKPPGNSTNAFALIYIDRLTGRARLERQRIQ